MNALRLRIAVVGVLATGGSALLLDVPVTAAAGGPSVTQLKNVYRVLKRGRQPATDTPSTALRGLITGGPPAASWRRMAANYADATGGVKRAWLGVKPGQLCYIVTSSRSSISPTGRCIAFTRTSAATDPPIVIGLGSDTTPDGLHQRNRIAAIVPTGVDTVKVKEGTAQRFVAVRNNLAAVRYAEPACVTVQQNLRTVRLAGNSC